MQTLQNFLDLPWMRTALGVIALLALAWLAGQLAQRLLLRVVRGIARRTTWKWDDALFRRHTFQWLARMVPALAIQYGIMLVPGVSPRIEVLVGNLVTAFSAALSALEDLYRETPRGQQRSIKGLVQLVKLGLFVVAGLIIIAAVT